MPSPSRGPERPLVVPELCDRHAGAVPRVSILVLYVHAYVWHFMDSDELREQCQGDTAAALRLIEQAGCPGCYLGDERHRDLIAEASEEMRAVRAGLPPRAPWAVAVRGNKA